MSTVSPEIYPEHTEAGAFTTWHSTETGPRCHGRSSLLQPEHLTFLLPVCLITCNCPLGKQIWRKCKLWICLLNDQTRFPPAMHIPVLLYVVLDAKMKEELLGLWGSLALPGEQEGHVQLFTLQTVQLQMSQCIVP